MLILPAGNRLQPAASQAPVQPEPGADGEGTASAILIESQQKMNWVHQMRTLLQQASPFQQRLANQPELSMFQVAQATVDDAGGAAGGAGREVMLLQQKSAASGKGTFPGYGHTVNSATNHDHVK